MLHTDPAYAPADPKFWSFLNCEVQGDFCEASMSLAEVLVPPPGVNPPNLWKSWVTHRQNLPAQVVHEAHYKHVLSTPATIHSQSALRALQGQGGVWFAGGFTQPYDSQETALLSAMSVAEGLTAGTAARVRALQGRAG
jgi:predicted NAD/FAD-binding protein